ncbi:MAG: serine protease [Bdellovibrionota bacterium]
MLPIRKVHTTTVKYRSKEQLFFAIASLVILSVISILFLNRTALSNDDRVIYGEDNRIDVKDETDNLMVELSRSTAALVLLSEIKDHETDPSVKLLPSITLKEGINVCNNERFTNQPIAAICSGFIVAEDILITAGHCITTNENCEKVAFVFDYSLTTDESNPLIVKTKNIYKCAKIIERKLDPNNLNDFAVVKLDRAVDDRTPLKYRHKGRIAVGDPLTVIGHPIGLPTKIAGGAWVRSNEAEMYFTTNLDTYGGSSGSAVFNTETGVVEGILVRGENDYIYNEEEECVVSNQCPNEGCQGEDVTRISEIIRYIENPASQD